MPYRVVVEQFALLLRTPRADDFFEGVHPLCIGGLERADRPVAAEDNAVGAEAVETIVDDRCEIGRFPSLGLGGDDDAGNLADHIVPLGQFPHAPLPGVDRLFVGAGHIHVAAMIENKPRLWALIDQLHRVNHLATAHAQVVAEIHVAQQLHVFDELRLQAQPGRDLCIV